MADAIANILANHDLGETFDLFTVDGGAETDPGGLGLSEHLAILSLHTGGANRQTWKFKDKGDLRL